jgi:hypothetical protein
MQRTALPFVLLAAFLLALTSSPATFAVESKVRSKKAKPAKPAHRVVVMYFHRTKRCPTCQKMGAYTEQSVMTHFGREAAEGKVELHFIDFEDPKNAALAKAYKVTGPSLVMARVVNGRVVAAKNLKEIWAKKDNPGEFDSYVRDHVKAYEPPPNRVVVLYFHRTKRCPTCRTMGAYSEEAVLKGFGKQVKQGDVEFCYVNFEDKKNAAMTKAYHVTGPSLIVATIAKNKLVAAENLKEIWMKKDDKKSFLKYVRDGVAAGRKRLPRKAAAQARKPVSSEPGKKTH